MFVLSVFSFHTSDLKNDREGFFLRNPVRSQSSGFYMMISIVRCSFHVSPTPAARQATKRLLWVLQPPTYTNEHLTGAAVGTYLYINTTESTFLANIYIIIVLTDILLVQRILDDLRFFISNSKDSVRFCLQRFSQGLWPANPM